MGSFEKTHGPAAILAIGTANPANFIYQADYPDYFFRVTKSEHLTELKDKFKRICDKSMIRKRHFYLTEEILDKHPNITSFDASSLNARQDILVAQVPELAKEAAMEAIKEWGQPKTRITHLVFSALAGVDMPGLDCQLITLLGLDPSVKRVMLYQHGCYVGGTVLRIAKDIAENNPDARVLVVCSDMTIGSFRGPSYADISCLIGQAVTSDGAAALIISACPEIPVEKPLFQIISATQTMLPDSLNAIQGHIQESGLTMTISKDVASLVADNIEKLLVEAFNPIRVSDWNSLFWIVQTGGPAFLNRIEAKVGLEKERLSASRHVLSEYGNMGGPTVFFVMDEMKRKSMEGRKSSTGEGKEWGVLIGYGAGVTIDVVVLRSVPLL